jgi:hypothetical protein
MKNAHLYWHEASGLDPSNRLTYIVESGDGPIRIAKKLVGDGNRWRELLAANPKKKVASNGNFVSLLVGERINVPVSWEQDMTKITPAGGAVVVPAAVDAAPAPTVVPVIVPVTPAQPATPPPGGATPSVQPASVVSTISTTPAASTAGSSSGTGLLALFLLGLGAYLYTNKARA